MLLGIDPLLRGPLLAALDGMGHGDVVVVADANFPARRLGSRVIALVGVDATRALRAVVSVLPVDADEPVSLMATADGGPVPIHGELAQASGARPTAVELLGRQEFYELAARAELVVHTGEMRAYGNVALRKGVRN